MIYHFISLKCHLFCSHDIAKKFLICHYTTITHSPREITSEPALLMSITYTPKIFLQMNIPVTHTPQMSLADEHNSYNKLSLSDEHNSYTKVSLADEHNSYTKVSLADEHNSYHKVLQRSNTSNQ